MDDLIRHYLKTIYEVGYFVLRALLWMNGCALALSWQPHTFPQVWPVVAPYFLAGAVAAIGGLAMTYLAAQVAIGGRDLGGWWFAGMCGLPVLALVFFICGITASFPVLQ